MTPTQPARIARLPVHKGYPVPWFVAWIDGVPDFRVADGRKLWEAVRHSRCWVCGDKLGSKLAFGRASEKITARIATIISVLLQAVGVLIIATVDAAPLLWLGIIVFALGFGGLGALIVLLVQEAFGMKEFGGIMGLIQVGMIVSGTGAPLMAGALHDSTGSFDSTFLVIVGIFAVGILSLAISRPVAADPEIAVERV